MTTQDDEQAREDWERLGPTQQRCMMRMDNGQAWDSVYRDTGDLTQPLFYGLVHVVSTYSMTPRGQRCAAYGRKVTSG